MERGNFTKANEGLTLTARKDSKGWEIGYGHNSPEVVEGLIWTKDEADTQFDYDFDCAEAGARQTLTQVWDSMGDARQEAFSDLVYELGLHGFTEFEHAISFALAQDWDECAHEIANSKYAFQVVQRARRVCALVRSGDWAVLEGSP